MHNFCIAHICKHSLTGTQQAIVEKHQQCCNNTQASRQISAMKATGIPDSSRAPPPKGNLPTRHQPGPQPGLAVGPYTALTATTCRHHHAPSQWRSTDLIHCPAFTRNAWNISLNCYRPLYQYNLL